MAETNHFKLDSDDFFVPKNAACLSEEQNLACFLDDIPGFVEPNLPRIQTAHALTSTEKTIRIVIHSDPPMASEPHVLRLSTEFTSPLVLVPSSIVVLAVLTTFLWVLCCRRRNLQVPIPEMVAGYTPIPSQTIDQMPNVKINGSVPSLDFPVDDRPFSRFEQPREYREWYV
uniref:Uncharacterized protein n=1 Tax=Panagrolaimus sp. JU765 TaxID=591449 RepID=A0AC34QQZ9_9BILA